MYTFKIVVSVIVGWALHNILEVNGVSYPPVCVDCKKNLRDCNFAEDFFYSDDMLAIAARNPDDRINPRYEDCLLPDIKLIKKLDGYRAVVCSATKYKTCGVITSSFRPIYYTSACEKCAKQCNCTFNSGQPTIIKNVGKLLRYLVVFHIMMVI